MDEFRKCRRCGTTFKVGVFQVFPDLCGRCKDEKAHQKKMEELAERKSAEQKPEEWTSLADDARAAKEEIEKVREIYQSALVDLGLPVPEKPEKPIDPKSTEAYKLWLEEKNRSEGRKGCFYLIVAALLVLTIPAFLVHIFISPNDGSIDFVAYVFFFACCALAAFYSRKIWFN